MIILSAKNLTKNYGVDVIFENASFHINKGDRVGIVGANGAGKTTLLNVLAGELEAESGDFFISAGTTLGYLKQKDNFNPERTLLEEVNYIFHGLHEMEKEMESLSLEIAKRAEEECESEQYAGLLARYANMQEEFKEKGGFTYKSEIKGILGSMAFDESYFNKKIGLLSGGERTRLALACLLLEKPDILLLDEPTNHLDIGTLKWLEQYLKGYSGTIILVSHDRYFLDQTVNRIFQVENHHLTCFNGNYSKYAVLKKEQREAELRAFNKQQTEIKRQEDLIRRYKERGTEKLAKRAASREKRLASIEKLNRPDAQVGKMKIHFRQEYQSGKDVLFAEDLAKSFGYGAGKKELFKDVAFDIKRGEKICIVGPNGVGKTTLLKIIMEELSPSSGYVKVGHNVNFGYYDQGQQLLNPDATVLEEVHDSYRFYTDGEVRNILGRFLFRGEQVFLKVGSLSGGEKARLALLKLMLSGANVLLLDEPTNHLDIDSKEVFEEALLDYPGTVITVSHDRYFLNKIPNRIFELTKTGIVSYLGSYNYYVEKKASIESGKKYLEEMKGSSEFGERPKEEKNDLEGATLSAAEERALKKKKEAQERKLKREREALEAFIEETEGEIGKLEEEMCLPKNTSNSGLLRELAEKVEILKKKLDEAYDKWAEM